MDKNTGTAKKKGFFNLFDVILIGVVLVIAVVFLMWQAKDSADSSDTPDSKTVQYTIELTGMQESTTELINVGDVLIDNIKRGEMGKIVSVDFENTKRSTKNMETGEFIMSEIPWLKTAIIVLEANCTESDSAIMTEGGFQVRAGDTVSVKGPGYAGKGFVIGVDRGE